MHYACTGYQVCGPIHAHCSPTENRCAGVGIPAPTAANTSSGIAAMGLPLSWQAYSSPNLQLPGRLPAAFIGLHVQGDNILSAHALQSRLLLSALHVNVLPAFALCAIYGDGAASNWSPSLPSCLSLSFLDVQLAPGRDKTCTPLREPPKQAAAARGKEAHVITVHHGLCHHHDVRFLLASGVRGHHQSGGKGKSASHGHRNHSTRHLRCRLLRWPAVHLLLSASRTTCLDDAAKPCCSMGIAAFSSEHCAVELQAFLRKSSCQAVGSTMPMHAISPQ